MAGEWEQGMAGGGRADCGWEEEAENVGGGRERQEAGPREKRKAKAEEKQQARSRKQSTSGQYVLTNSGYPRLLLLLLLLYYTTVLLTLVYFVYAPISPLSLPSIDLYPQNGLAHPLPSLLPFLLLSPPPRPPPLPYPLQCLFLDANRLQSSSLVMRKCDTCPVGSRPT